jgi:hypothetical protein
MATTKTRPSQSDDDSEQKIVSNLLHEQETQAASHNDGSLYHQLMQEEAKTAAQDAKENAQEEQQDEDEAVANGLNNAESNPAAVNDTIGTGYKKSNNNDEKKNKLLSLGTIKKVARAKIMASGIITLVLGGSIIALLSIASGPGQLLHAAALGLQTHMDLNNYIMKINVSKTIQYARTVQNPEQRNMGYIGNKIANYYETKLKANGLTPHYGDNRIKSFTIDTNTDAGKRAVDNMLKEGVPESELIPGRDGKIELAVDRTKSTALRRAIVSGMVKSVGMNKVISAIAGRSLRLRAGVNTHIKNIVRDKDEDIKDYRNKVQKEKTDYYKNGVKPAAGTLASEDNTNKDDQNAGGDNKEASDAASGANDIMEEAQSDKPQAEKVKSIRAKFTAGVGITSLLATVCGVQAIGNAVGDLRYSNIVAPLTRQGMDTPIMASQMEDGSDINADQVGVTVDDMYDKDTKQSWIDAGSVQAARNVEVTGPDLPDAAKPGNNLTPQFFIVVAKIIGAIPGFGAFCSLVSTTAGGWILSAVGIAATATGPVSLILNAASEAAQQLLANAFVDDLVRWLAGDQVNPLPKGAEWGNTMMYGMKLASNDASIAEGGVQLSNAQDAEWLAVLDNTRQVENQHAPLYAKYLDVNNPDSLLAKALFEAPAVTTTANDPTYAMASIAKMPMGILSSLGNSLGSIFSTKAMAAGKPFDYGFPTFATPLQDVDDPALQDPYANADKVEPKLAELNEKYGTPCFNRTVDPTTFQLQTADEMKRYDQLPDLCKDQNNQELKEYSFYIATLIGGKAQLCLLGIDTSMCAELGYGTPAATDTSTATNTIDMAHLYDDSTSVACAANTKDLGTADGYHAGKKFKIRICAVSNIKCTSGECNGEYGVHGADGKAVVNSRVSGVYYALAAQAATDGVTMTANSSFRTMEHQQQLCPCDGVTVAKPGNSNHQAGLAIDFGTPSGSAIRNGDKYFVWLQKNAATFGIKNYPRESWHWSPTGN